jgi:hypothetical protein
MLQVSPVTLAHSTHSVGEDNRKVADQMGAAWGNGELNLGNFGPMLDPKGHPLDNKRPASY